MIEGYELMAQLPRGTKGLEDVMGYFETLEMGMDSKWVSQVV